MKKNIIYILGVISLVACNSSQENSVKKHTQTIITESDSLIIINTEFDLNGIWALTNYFDTIVENKELAKYRLQTPTWFAILLEIENDSIKTFGSISTEKLLIENEKDTLATLSSNITGSKWWLIKKGDQLNLIQYPNQKRHDSITYIFRKREEFDYFTKENTDFFIIGQNVTKYFNQQLFKGKYFIQDTQNKVVFKADGSLTGIDKFDTYEVRNYFGTSHSHKNLDVITFKNENDNIFKQYNWVFKNELLILTEFAYEKVTHNGKVYDGDDLILGKEKIVLKKH